MQRECVMLQVWFSWLPNKEDGFFLQQSFSCCLSRFWLRKECKSDKLLAQQVSFTISRSVFLHFYIFFYSLLWSRLNPLLLLALKHFVLIAAL